MSFVSRDAWMKISRQVCGDTIVSQSTLKDNAGSGFDIRKSSAYSIIYHSANFTGITRGGVPMLHCSASPTEPQATTELNLCPPSSLFSLLSPSLLSHTIKNASGRRDELDARSSCLLIRSVKLSRKGWRWGRDKGVGGREGGRGADWWAGPPLA